MFFNSFFLEEFFTGKHLCQSLFFWHKCFPANSTKFLRTPFLQNTSEDCFCKCKVNTALPFYLKLFHYNCKYQWKKIKKKVRGLFNLKKQKQLSGGVLYGKVCLEIYCKFTGEHPCRSVISINLLLISRTPFSTEHLQTTASEKTLLLPLKIYKLGFWEAAQAFAQFWLKTLSQCEFESVQI